VITRQMRETFKPWAVIDGKELVSYPWPEGGRIYINARLTPGDPTMMRMFQLVDGALLLVKSVPTRKECPYCYGRTGMVCSTCEDCTGSGEMEL